jgi:hypothetical protein
MTGVALMFFMQGLGGAVFVSVGQTVFTQSLIKKLSVFASISPEVIVHTGATEIRNIVPAQYLPEVLTAYNGALSDTFKVSLACAIATLLAGFTMEWKSVKGKNNGGPQDEKSSHEKGEEANTDTETVVESPPKTAEPEPAARDTDKAHD